MKIVDAGDTRWLKWWVGKPGECQTCKRMVVLEEGDPDRADFISMNRDGILFQCPNCHDVIEVLRT
jgi:hypothetical protein